MAAMLFTAINVEWTYFYVIIFVISYKWGILTAKIIKLQMGSNHKLSYLQILPSSVHHASLQLSGGDIYVTCSLQIEIVQISPNNFIIYTHTWTY